VSLWSLHIMNAFFKKNGESGIYIVMRKRERRERRRVGERESTVRTCMHVTS
jgi:hypothetical protein